METAQALTPVASLTYSSMQLASKPVLGTDARRRAAKSSASPIEGYRVPTTARLDGPGQGRRVPKGTGWLFSKGRAAKRWLSGVGIGAGGFFFIGPSGCHAAMAGILPNLPTEPFKRIKKKNQRNVLILMSNTGGGHRASAEAIRAGFKQMYGDKFHFDIVDAWKDHTPSPFNNLPDTYSFLVKQPILWRFAYTSQQPRIIHKPYMWTCGTLIGDGLNGLYEKYQPDLVVSVHPLMQHIPIRILNQRVRKGLMPPINFATVVTDFTTCSNLWFHKGVQACFVPTDYCADRARLMGLKEHQIVQHGLPIRPDFARASASKERLRKRLGLDAHLPAVLLVGGGEGMGKIEQTVSAIGEQGTACQVVVICGRNEQLRKRLSTGNYGASVQVHAQGFVTNMHEWMRCCDAIITKAGPGTIAEALISGLPILLNGNVPCQEEGNIPYVVDNKCGTFERNPRKIAEIWDEWIRTPALLQEMASNSKRLGRPDALFKIVADLADLSKHEGLLTRQTPQLEAA